MVSELVARLKKAAEFAEGIRSAEAGHEDSDCEPHWSYQGEAEDASKTCIEAADRIEALEADNRMKDELLTAAVGDYNDALAKVRALEGEIYQLKNALSNARDQVHEAETRAREATP